MTPEIQNQKIYDLEERTFKFAQNIRKYIAGLPRNAINIEDAKQLLRSSGSIGANYIEANESFSKKDFVMRIKICRKEAKETCYWLKLLNEGGILTRESGELTKIFGAILEKSK